MRERGDQLLAARTDVDGDGAGAFEQRVGRARDDEPTGVDHHDVVAHLLHVVEQVRRHQHRDAERPEPGDEREHVVASDRVEPGGRFVEQDELGIADDRLRELRALPHARSRTRRSAGIAPRRARRGRGCRTRVAARPRAGNPLSSPNVDDDVGGGLIERQAVVLGHVAEPRPHADRVARDVDAAHLDVALRRVGEAEQQAEGRRLAGAVGADEADAPARHLDASGRRARSCPDSAWSVRRCGEAVRFPRGRESVSKRQERCTRKGETLRGLTQDCRSFSS